MMLNPFVVLIMYAIIIESSPIVTEGLFAIRRFCLQVGNGSTADVSRATVANNTAPARAPPNGGGIFVSGNSSLALADSAVEGNAALRDGGGLHFDGGGGGALSLARVVMRDNRAQSFGGGMRALNALPLVAAVFTVPPAPALDFFLLPASNGKASLHWRPCGAVGCCGLAGTCPSQLAISPVVYCGSS